MFGKKKAAQIPVVEEKKEKPVPAYLRPDYPYQAVGEPITDLSTLEPTGVLYEIMCPNCQMSMRSQGLNTKSTYDRLMESGCLGCKAKEFIVKRVDMSKMPEIEAARKAASEAKTES